MTRATSKARSESSWISPSADSSRSNCASCKQQMQAQDLNLNTVVQGMSQMLMRLLGAPIALEFKAAPELPSVNGDFGMMEQILLNLAVNARDATPRDGRLTITTATREIAETETH